MDDIRKKVTELASIIDAPGDLLPDYGVMKWEGHPYIELDNRGWLYYVVSERGNRTERLAIDLDHLLYLIFDSVTFDMAFDYELKNRIEDKDCRRMAFEKQEELLGLLSDKWRHQKIEENKRILFIAPFDDLGGLRASYWRQLKQQGYSSAEVERLAYERYPKPGRS